jgi:hypothetical protein
MSVSNEEHLGDVVALNIDDPDLDLEKAKDAAKIKAKEYCKDPMLLSWKNGKTETFFPNFECGSSERPAWIVFAEARGGDLTINVNNGKFVFIYLKL